METQRTIDKNLRWNARSRLSPRNSQRFHHLHPDIIHRELLAQEVLIPEPKPKPYRVDFEGTLFQVEADGALLEFPYANFDEIEKAYEAYAVGMQVVVRTRLPKSQWDEVVARTLEDHGIPEYKIVRKRLRKPANK